MKEEDNLSRATNRRDIRKLKFVLLGDQYVGKSSLITRFVKGEFEESGAPTIGIDFVSKNISIGGQTFRLQLWDTAGQERYKSLIPNYVRDCQIVIIVFDSTNQESMAAVNRWLDFAKESTEISVTFAVFANKIDLPNCNKTALEAARTRYKELSIPYFQVSAKTGEGLLEAFKELVTIVIKVPVPLSDIMEIEKTKRNNLDELTFPAPQTKKHVTLPSATKLSSLPFDSPETRQIREKNCC